MEENNSASIQTGSLAPDFCLPSHQGGEVCLSDYRGKSQVIVFFVREFI